MTRAVLAIDPGSEQSAWVRVAHGIPVAFAKAPNHDVLDVVKLLAPHDYIAIEWPHNAGPGGATILDTAAWAGRFLQRWNDAGGRTPALVYRNSIKAHLLGTTRGNDTAVRRAIIDRFVAEHGGREHLTGIANDVWQALACAIAFDETIRPNRPEGTDR